MGCNYTYLTLTPLIPTHEPPKKPPKPLDPEQNLASRNEGRLRFHRFLQELGARLAKGKP